MLFGTASYADSAADIQRALLERQQRADEFALRIEQSKPAPGALKQQLELDALHLQNLQRLQNLNARQLRQFDATRASPADPRAERTRMLLQQQQFERDRQIELRELRSSEQRLRDTQREDLRRNRVAR